MADKKSSTTVVFNAINVNAIDDLSGIFVGDNIQLNWGLNYKENHGFGTIIGRNNMVFNPLNIVSDPDIIDYPVNQTLLSKGQMKE